MKSKGVRGVVAICGLALLCAAVNPPRDAARRAGADRAASEAAAFESGRRRNRRAFGIGRPATPARGIAAWDIDVGPDGAGLPPGRGTSADERADLRGALRELPRQNRQRGAERCPRRAPARRRLYLRARSASAEDHRQLLAVCHDRIRLHSPRHATRRARIAGGQRRLQPRRVPAVPERTDSGGRRDRCVDTTESDDAFRDRFVPEKRGKPRNPSRDWLLVASRHS